MPDPENGPCRECAKRGREDCSLIGSTTERSQGRSCVSASPAPAPSFRKASAISSRVSFQVRPPSLPQKPNQHSASGHQQSDQLRLHQHAEEQPPRQSFNRKRKSDELYAPALPTLAPRQAYPVSQTGTPVSYSSTGLQTFLPAYDTHTDATVRLRDHQQHTVVPGYNSSVVPEPLYRYTQVIAIRKLPNPLLSQNCLA